MSHSNVETRARSPDESHTRRVSQTDGAGRREREGGRETQVEEQSQRGDEGLRGGGEHSETGRVKEAEREV